MRGSRGSRAAGCTGGGTRGACWGKVVAPGPTTPHRPGRGRAADSDPMQAPSMLGTDLITFECSRHAAVSPPFARARVASGGAGSHGKASSAHHSGYSLIWRMPRAAASPALLADLANRCLAGEFGSVSCLEAPQFPRVPDDLRRADGRSANGWPVTTCRVLVTSQADSFWPRGRQSSQDIVNAASTGPAPFSCHERWARHGRSGPWRHITSHSRCAC